MALIMLEKPKAAVATPEIHKVLVQPIAQAETATEALVNEYIDLHRKFVFFEVKDLVKRMEDIRKQLMEIANNTVEGNKPAIFVGDQGEIEFSERVKKAEVPEPLSLVSDLLDKFGPEVTSSVVSIALTPLRKVLTEHELKKYLKEEPGGRTLRGVRLTKEP